MSASEPKRTPITLVILWIARLTASGILGYASYLKLADNPGDVRLFSELGMEPFGRLLIAALEMLSAVLILVPQSAIYGALLGFGIMIGAIIGHLTVFGPGHLHVALLVLASCGTILWIRRNDAGFLRNLTNHYKYGDDA